MSTDWRIHFTICEHVEADADAAAYQYRGRVCCAACYPDFMTAKLECRKVGRLTVGVQPELSLSGSVEAVVNRGFSSSRGEGGVLTCVTLPIFLASLGDWGTHLALGCVALVIGLIALWAADRRDGGVPR